MLARLRTGFPDREFIMRSQGHVHFIRISSRTQMLAAGGVAALALIWIVSLGVATLSGMNAAANQAELLNREAKVAKAEDRVHSYRESIDGVADDLARRQQFIEQVVEAHIGDLPKDRQTGETVSDSDAEAKRTIDKVSAAIPEASALARIEASQLAFVERLTRYADRRSANATQAIRKLGLNPNAIVANSGRGEGGPLISLATAGDGSIDPRFQRLGLSLARMDTLESGLASIPQVNPTTVAYVSSSYGYRRDPFTRGGAFHAGLDFPGPMGSPIFAAAKGTVTFVGRRSGYGNCIEVTHGNGLMTRYAHLSRFAAHVGETVDAGTRIAAMGSTGRSTGSHLHFEVRVNGRPVNPRPFLEAAAIASREAAGKAHDHVHQES